ncbi:MAG: hypothetical protein EAZ95_10465 [Bacteroidetes bacterium]|nr:MAG: hypothetical protein EAZ95_10465 [Bacteroidota bacterium]
MRILLLKLKSVNAHGNKNGINLSLQEKCLNNIHFRNYLTTILQITATSYHLSSSFTEEQKREASAIANAYLSSNNIPENPLGFLGYSETLYQNQKSYLLQEYEIFQNDLPEFQQSTLQEKRSILASVISDILIDNPNDPIYVIMGFYECVADALQEYTDNMVKCKKDAACQAWATGRVAFRTYLCTLLN